MRTVVGTGRIRAITNARVVTSREVVEGASVVLEEGRIAGVSARTETSASGETLDAAGRYVLPGMVDLHTDALERESAPRPGAYLPNDAAFLAADRLLASCGVTTAFDSVAFMDALPRRVSRAQSLCEAVLDLRHEALVRHELHLRCELPQPSSVEAVEALLRRGAASLVSVMDHTPGRRQFRDFASYERFYRETRGADEEVLNAALEAHEHSDDRTITKRMGRIFDAAREGGAVLASHDDDRPDEVRRLARRGLAVCEFPIDEKTARAAKGAGLVVCVGAPNALRGRSSGGNLSAREAIRKGLVDVLASDYHAPSMLLAAFRLADEGVLSLPGAVGLVCSRPARAAQMVDRGEIREGAAADVIVAGNRFGLPTVIHTIVAGTIAASSCPTRR